MITAASCPQRETSTTSEFKQWHSHLNRQLREVTVMKASRWRVRKPEDLCVASHPWLPWVNTTAIQGILKRIKNTGNKHITDIHKFPNILRESSTNLTLTALFAESPYFLTAHLSPLMSSSWGDTARLSGSSEPMLRSLSDSLSSSECIAGPEEEEKMQHPTLKSCSCRAWRLLNQVSNYLPLQGNSLLQVQSRRNATAGTRIVSAGRQ